ncbi:hypothetical protein BDZ97DRAFT_1251631 [Flammula alnicola]|nr:hypothetical protein BDZ97DRAFT_1251631 [Flammula alnicola]
MHWASPSHFTACFLLPPPSLSFLLPKSQTSSPPAAMLKRQRPPSPSSSSIPFINDSPADLIERNSKRRRTVPPVLDGTARGWAAPRENEEEEDYTYSDHEVDIVAPRHDYQQQAPSQYKSTNTMLRELHTLHQHRLLFATSTVAHNSDTNATITSPLYPAPYPRHATPEKGHLQPQHDRLRTAHVSPLIDKGSQVNDTSMEEVNRVTERYEGTNKFLGSLFLSRRRKLDSSDEIPAHVLAFRTHTHLYY